MMKPFRLHPLTILMSWFKLLKQWFIVILLLFVFHFSDQSTTFQFLRFLFVLFIIYQMTIAIIRWWKTTYEIKHGMMYQQHGLLQKKQDAMPLDAVQNITWHTPFLFRPFRITSLKLETSAASEQSTVKLDALRLATAEQIEELVTTYRAVESRQTEDVQRPGATADNTSSFRQAETIHFTPSRKDLLKASFLSFSFLGLVPVLAVGYRQLNRVIDIDARAQNALSYLTNSWMMIFGVSMLLVVLAVASGIVQTFLKYGNYEIASNEERILIRSGMLNEKAFSIKKANVQAVRVMQSPLKKLLGFSEIKLISAGSDEGEGEDISTLYPFLPSDRASSLLEELLPQFPIKNATNRLPRSALYIRMMRPPWFWLIVTGLLLWWKPEWWFLSLLLFMMTYAMRLFTYRNTRFAWDDASIQLKTGGLSTDLFITNRHKVISISAEQTLLQKKWRVATIKTVNRVKPVHEEQLVDIPYHKAQQFIQWYQQRAREVETE